MCGRCQLGRVARGYGGLDAREPGGKFLKDQPHECPYQGRPSDLLQPRNGGRIHDHAYPHGRGGAWHRQAGSTIIRGV